MRLKPNLMTLRTAGRLGWAIEANWADPLLFAIYSIVRPIFSTLILVFMYKVIAGGKTDTELFAFIYLGNAFFMYVTNLLSGMGAIVHDDREQYEMLKYIYVAPINKYAYLIGRGLPKLFLTTLAVIITLTFGIFVFHLKIDWQAANWLLFLVAFPVGLFAALCLGLILAAVCLNTARHGFALSEGSAGVFYLAIGAVFPIDVLPHWLQKVSLFIPLTYWLELLRRSLGAGGLSQTLSRYSNGHLLWILFLTALGLALTAHLVYQWMEHLARKQGKLDLKFNY